MRLAFYRSAKEGCRLIAGIFRTGMLVHGDTLDEHAIGGDFNNPADAIAVLAVKRREIFDYAQANEIPLLYFDKGYTRTRDWKRIAFNGCEPGTSLGLYGFKHDRRRLFNWEPKPWRTEGNHIVIASSSPKEHKWRNLPPPEEHAAQLVEELRLYTDRPILYRCKPNLNEKGTVPGTIQSEDGRTIQEDLKGAHALITVGSSVALWAALEGVPSIILGDAVSVGFSSSSLSNIEHPRLGTEEEVIAVLNDLAYHQWSMEEFESGKAWSYIKRMLFINAIKQWQKTHDDTS